MALSGRRASEDELTLLKTAVPWTPDWLAELMTRFPLSNTIFSISDSDDESGLGVEMRWLSATAIVDEATNAYPGIVAARHLYLPIGECLAGTGDPYFIRGGGDTSPVFRIPHAAVRGEDLDLSAIERVAPSIERFFELGVVGGTGA